MTPDDKYPVREVYQARGIPGPRPGAKPGFFFSLRVLLGALMLGWWGSVHTPQAGCPWPGPAHQEALQLPGPCQHRPPTPPFSLSPSYPPYFTFSLFPIVFPFHFSSLHFHYHSLFLFLPSPSPVSLPFPLHLFILFPLYSYSELKCSTVNGELDLGLRPSSWPSTYCCYCGLNWPKVLDQFIDPCILFIVLLLPCLPCCPVH